MKPLTNPQLKALGFTIMPRVKGDEFASDGFSYQVAEIKTNTSFIEVINEYRDNKLTAQFTNYKIIEDGERSVDVELIKRLKKIIL